MSFPAGEQVLDYSGLVASVARRAAIGAPRDVEYMDLYQQGFLHLLLAASGFDSGRGNGFATYATWRVRGGIASHLRRLGPAGHRCREGDRESNGAWTAFEDRAGEAISHRWLPSTRATLRVAVARLPRSQQEVLALLYGWELTEREAAKELGCTWALVETQHRLAILRLRSELWAQLGGGIPCD